MKSFFKIILISTLLFLCSAVLLYAADASDGADTDAKGQWMAEKSQLQTKMANFKAIRNSVRECVDASGIDMEKADKETIQRTVDGCLVEAGIDADAKKAEMEAFRAAVAAMQACMQSADAFDAEMIDLEVDDLDALKGDMKQCLSEVGFDWNVWSPEASTHGRKIKSPADSSDGRRAGGCAGGANSANTGKDTDVPTDQEPGTDTTRGKGPSAVADTDTDADADTDTDADTDAGTSASGDTHSGGGGAGIEVPVEASVPMKVAPGCMIDSLIYFR